MSNGSNAKRRPDYLAKIAEQRQGQRPYWREVGAAWTHESGEGCDLVIAPGLSVAGRISLFLNKPKDDETVEDDAE